jgi:hypothetical protein
MAESPWAYDPRVRRYRDTRTGRWLSEQRVVGQRDGFAAVRALRARALTDSLVAGDVRLPAWVSAMRADLKATYAAQYLLGIGGRSRMTPSDWGRLGAMLKAQYRYLDRFAGEVALGWLTPAMAAARAALYARSAVQAHAAGQARAWRVTLPARPGDGSTPCLANCRCYWWLVEQDDDTVAATWVRTSAEGCRPCAGRAGLWAPLVIVLREAA